MPSTYACFGDSYVEIGSVLEPVITRDEFVKSKERDELYGELALVEDELKVALAQMIEQHKDESLEQLEDVLGDSITKVLWLNLNALTRFH